MKKLFIFIAFVLLAAIGLNLLADKIIFRPFAEVAPMPDGFTEVFINSNTENALNGVYKPAQEGKPVILFFHGNSGNISYYRRFAEIYSAYGYGVLMFDYRGFGKSRGKLSQESFFEDASAMLKAALEDFNIPPQNLVLYSHSLGNAGLLKALAGYKGFNFKAVIMQSPFTNTPDMASSFITPAPYKPESIVRKALSAVFGAVLYNKLFNNLEAIKQITQPVFMLYNRQDLLIPWQMSDTLFKSAPEGSANYISHYGGHHAFDWSKEEVQNYLLSLDSPAKQ